LEHYHAFRLYPDELRNFIHLFGNDPVFISRGTKPQAPPPLYQLGLVLYRLAHSPGVRELSFLFRVSSTYFLLLLLPELIGLAVGGVHLWTGHALKAILRRAPEFIPWPNAIERSIIKGQSERNYGIPDCVGLMDGCHVNLKAQPAREHAGALHSWKNKSGLLFVAILDYNLRICYIQYGYPALSSDHRVQRSMNVFTEHPLYFSPSEYVLAESDFTATNLCVLMFTKPAR